MSDEDNFTAGFLICLSSLIGGFGIGTEAEELFAEIGRPSAREIRRLGLSEYDRTNLNAVRKSCR